MAYFTGLDRAFTPCSPETFDRGLRTVVTYDDIALDGQSTAVVAPTLPCSGTRLSERQR
jgi:hypothetical protein